MEMINFEKKEIIPLTNKEIKSYEKQKVCYVCEKSFVIMTKTRKMSEITVTIPENLEDLLIIFAI